MKTKLKTILLVLVVVIANLRSFASCTAPASSAGTPVITCQSATSMTITWTAAGAYTNCDGYVLVRRTTAAGTFTLNAGTALPTVSSSPVTFGNVMNCYIDYVGSGLSATSNVTANTQYYYYVIPYNDGIGGCTPAPIYRTTSPATVTNTVPVVGAVSNFSNGAPTATTIPNISFTPPTGGADGYLVCTNPNGYYSTPDNDVTYNVGDVFNHGSGSPWDQTVQYVGPNTSGITASTNLTPGLTYSITVYPYRSRYTCSGGPVYIGTIARTTKDGVVMQTNVGLADYSNSDAAKSIFIFPTSREIKIRNESKPYGVEKLDIYSILGEKILSVSLPFEKGKEETIDIASLSKGLYFLQLYSGSAIVTRKFVKQ